VNIVEKNKDATARLILIGELLSGKESSQDKGKVYERPRQEHRHTGEYLALA